MNTINNPYDVFDFEPEEWTEAKEQLWQEYCEMMQELVDMGLV